jgi:hypothetical protein
MNGRLWLLAMCVLANPVLVNAQIENYEMTWSLEQISETLTPEEGSIPTDSDVPYSNYMGRLRLQDKRRFPLYEIGFSFKDARHINLMARMDDVSSFRFAGMQRLPFGGLTAKVLYVDSNPGSSTPTRAGGAYLMGGTKKLNLSAGFEFESLPEPEIAGGDEEDDPSLLSLRAKYDLDRLVLMAGGALREDDRSRLVAGGMSRLPGQFLLGGLIGLWGADDNLNPDSKTGYAVNVGRFNRFGDFAGLPSFSLNYIEVPETYKWTNFRIMWGAAGIHYVAPTFSNPLFSGQYDIDMGLMLTELVPDNFRHYDSPLVFKRYDEYGKLALRVNHIDTESGFRKFDANVSFNPGIHIGAVRFISAIVTIERIHKLKFKWQGERYHLTLAGNLQDRVYCGITVGSDFEDFQRVMFEVRVN